MSPQLTTLNARTADPALKPLYYLDLSGAGTGPFVPVQATADGSGNPITSANPLPVAIEMLALPPNAAQETGGNLATVAAAQGQGATGVSQPAGGSGLLGWLSGIYSKLSNTLTIAWSGAPNVTVSNFPATQPVSATALPLPANAAQETGGNLAAAASSLTAAVAKLSSILAALGSPFQVGGSVGNTAFGATQSGSWNVGVASLPSIPAGTNTIGAISNASFAISGNLPPFASAPTVSDAQSAPFAGAVAMTVGTTYPAQRSVGVLCTGAGNVTFQFSDASTLTLPVAVGWQIFPFACTEIIAAGTTATATCYNLK
jgi:hypothetical protein